MTTLVFAGTFSRYEIRKRLPMFSFDLSVQGNKAELPANCDVLSITTLFFVIQLIQVPIFVLRMSFSGSGALNNAFLSGRHTRPPRKANKVGLQTFVTLVCADPLHYITLERPFRLG